MPNTRSTNAVRLEFAPGSLVQSHLSGAAFAGERLWVAGDDARGLDRLRRLDPGAGEVLRFGEIRVFRGPASRPSLAAKRDPVRFDAASIESASLPQGRGTNRAEAICDLPPALAGSKPSWLVLYDAPGADRRDGEHAVFGDLLRHD